MCFGKKESFYFVYFRVRDYDDSEMTQLPDFHYHVLLCLENCIDEAMSNIYVGLRILIFLRIKIL